MQPPEEPVIPRSECQAALRLMGQLCENICENGDVEEDVRGVTGCSLNLDRLAQITIRPTLKLAGLRWHGYYAGRRGGATVATSKTKDPTGTASMLRHKDARTTTQFYIGLTPEGQERAVKAVGDEYVAYERKQLADKSENESEISFCTALHSTSEMEVCK